MRMYFKDKSFFFEFSKSNFIFFPFLELLITDLFTTVTNVQANHLKKYAFILAYAASHNHTDSDQVNKERLNTTLTAIQEVSMLCKESKAYSSQANLQLGKQFDKYLQVNIASCGILKYIETSLNDLNYYGTPSASVTTPMFFYLLRRIIVLHPFQRDSVFKLLKNCFELNPSLDALAVVRIFNFSSFFKILLIHFFLIVGG